MHHKRFTLLSKFRHEGVSYAVGAIACGTHQADYLAFIDGRVVYKGHPDIPGYDWRWVSQPDGLAYLAGVLQRAGGKNPGMEPRTLESAVVPIPYGNQDDPDASEEKSSSPVVKAAADVAGATVLIGASLILAPVAVCVATIGVAIRADVESKRSRIEPGMSREALVEILGRPKIELFLTGSETKVLAYIPGDWSLNFAGNWYAGVREGQVIWTHGYSEWLNGLAGKAIEDAKQQR